MNGFAGFDWAVAIQSRVNEVLDGKVRLWSPTYSGDQGVAVWTSWWDDLTSLNEATNRLAKDAKYLELASQGTQHIVGRVTDQLSQVVSGDQSGSQDATWVSVVSAVCATEHLAAGMTGGIEIAQKVEKVIGRPTLFMSGVTGSYGGVAWITGYESIASFESATTKINSDIDFVTFLDTATGAYVENPAFTRSILYRLIG
ncbi:MAG: hypothetical protein ACRDVC_00320 [Acidimicrobiales bacterium]